MSKITQYTNHVALVVDASGSMRDIHNATVKAFDGIIDSLRESAKKYNQETRVSVYLFDDRIEVLAFDLDVMRMPSIKDHYFTRNYTALAKATNVAMDDLEKLPELYTDHGFVVYTLTDGGENRSGDREIERLSDRLSKLKENWTVVAHVPNDEGRRQMMRLGYHRGNVEVWDTTEKGMEIAAQNFTRSADTYMQNRSKGIRGSSSYFQMDATKLNMATVTATLTPVSSRKFRLVQNPEAKAVQIKPLVEAATGESYVLGNSYYGLVKNETIQPQKKIIVREKTTGKVFAGDDARTLLGLPTNQPVLVRPTLSPNYDVFVQSTSVNRNVIPNQSVVVLR